MATVPTGRMTFGSLFSGIGGLDLGLERAGMECRWQVEIDEFCRKVLTKHWPSVPKYGDIRTITGNELERVDLIAGGFPCQDISYAGYGAGLEGERSGLWFEYARLIGILRPRYVLVENVSALLERGIGRVLGDLASIGYDAEWSPVSACSMGAPHPRQRMFIVAYPNGQHGREGIWDPSSQGIRALQAVNRLQSARAGWRARLADPSALYGGANGVPSRVDRLRGLGNAVVPQVAEFIGRAILSSEVGT
jgi:DNA (cytosine-5)-methyltransferase 1